MRKICQRCSVSFIKKENSTGICGYSKTRINTRIHEYINDNYDNCICSSCIKETVTYFDACNINPILVDKINKMKVK